MGTTGIEPVTSDAPPRSVAVRAVLPAVAAFGSPLGSHAYCLSERMGAGAAALPERSERVAAGVRTPLTSGGTASYDAYAGARIR
ncbi:hypothetical protein GCM10012287_38130 [Streptomyces daqingensis]|uniref:Uncharacterized protein n=1 Tax=Streptomyces daqingensis TaxID=1472640 RepID=A0ABQ2MJM0_9ACTN|nr:hypothetical protein GCM10012287_38130 [Streptomyces daqingensis]